MSILKDFGNYYFLITIGMKDETLAEEYHTMKYPKKFEAPIEIGKPGWLSFVGTAMAMLTCYGVTAVIGVLSLVGITIAVPFRAPFIIIFSAIAAVSLSVTYKKHHSRWVVFFGLAGFFLVTVSKFLPPTMKFVSIGLEGAGFICLVSGNILSFRLQRRRGLSCAVRQSI